MTWHAKALQTSYITPPGAGAMGEDEDESGVPEQHDLLVLPRRARRAGAAGTPVVVALRRLHHRRHRLDPQRRRPLARRARPPPARGTATGSSVVNAGIGGNQVVGPAEYAPDKPFPGGPSAVNGSSATCWPLRRHGT